MVLKTLENGYYIPKEMWYVFVHNLPKKEPDYYTTTPKPTPNVITLKSFFVILFSAFLEGLNGHDICLNGQIF